MLNYMLNSPSVKNLFPPFLKTTFKRQLISTITQSTKFDCLAVSIAFVKMLHLLFVKSSFTFTSFFSLLLLRQLTSTCKCWKPNIFFIVFSTEPLPILSSFNHNFRDDQCIKVRPSLSVRPFVHLLHFFSILSKDLKALFYIELMYFNM